MSAFDLTYLSLNSLLNSRFPLSFLTFVIVFPLNALLAALKSCPKSTRRGDWSIKYHAPGSEAAATF